MPAPDEHPATGESQVSPGDEPPPNREPPSQLRVHPFRGVRYDPARVSDLASVTSPPYDVIDADSATHLAALDPHNVVRLILPRSPGETRAGGYVDVAARLAEWLADGTLRRDAEPAIYVYEQVVDGAVQRGILAAVELRDPAERVVLPHEDVMPGPVADRLELMRATGANLEPILLVYQGGGGTAGVIESVAATPPLIEATTEDGLVQRVWPVTDPALHARINDDLGPRQALIADGHHRYATYRRLQAEKHASGRRDGPWDRGLALLVDSETYPLRLQAIHRVVRGLSPVDALAAAAEVFAVSPLDGDLDAALDALHAETRAHPFVLTDGSSFWLLTEPAERVVAHALPSAQSALGRSLDASILDAVLLDLLWSVDPTSERVRYVHDAAAALRGAQRSNGTAVLLKPVDLNDVLAVASRGERMPRKSTSFGPKPRTGLVLRLFDHDT